MGTQIYVSSTSVHALTREAVASFPKLADRAPLALVVDAFDDGQHAVSTPKSCGLPTF
jgi:hypothetical protein